ncbi:MAG: hypothetical protein MJZ14_08280 [Paludibacteraceae bacterium]|nr:hypothetical protein [Paludibacteraceae bacterium]
MKKILLGIIAAFSLAACVPPADYCDSVTRNVDAANGAIRDMTKAIKQRKETGDAASKQNLQNVYDKGYDVMKEACKNLGEMSDFRGDDALRQAASEYVSFYASYYDNQLKRVVEILRKDSVTEDDQLDLTEYLFDLGGKETEYKEKYSSSLLDFIKKNELNADGM